jgi:hypothetical protein
MKMLNSIWWTAQKNIEDFIDWWSSLSYTARGGGCLLVALILMWEATRGSTEGEHDRRFFVTGMAALSLLAYSAVLFSGGNPTVH